MNCEEFAHEVFVSRNDILTELNDNILDAEASKRVGILIGPPGMGKTWLMRDLETRWGEHGQLVFWLAIPELCKPVQIDTPIYNEEKAYEWLKKVFTKANEAGLSLERIEPPYRFISNYVDELARALCTSNERTRLYPPLLLVDGYDEVPPNEALTIGRAILDHFLRSSCTRIILGIRDPFSAHRTLVIRQHEYPILLKTGLEVRAQFRLFWKRYYPKVTQLQPKNLTTFLESVAEYTWDHPFINAFLFERALESAQKTREIPFLNPDDLKDCCLELINRQRYNPISVTDFNLLTIIAKQLGPIWEDRDLALIGIYTNLNELFKRGIIYKLEKDKRQIIPGLRSLLRNLKIDQPGSATDNQTPQIAV